MKIVGVGCGPGMLTEAAIQALRSATLIVGSKRALDIVEAYLPAGADIRIITNYATLKSLPDHAVILSTGDPMVSGLGSLGGEIIPGISSVQLGAAKTGVTLTNIILITAHGRDHERAIQECCDMIQHKKKVCIIADPDFPIEIMSKKLTEIDPEIRITLCENLGYPDERISLGTAQNPPVFQSGMFILFITPK